MSGTRPPAHRHRDLDTRDEIEEFVTRFYRDVAQDDLLDPYFNAIAHVDWHAHTGNLTDYWTGILLGTPRPEGDVIEAHRWLNDHTPFEPALFDRWGLSTPSTGPSAAALGPAVRSAHDQRIGAGNSSRSAPGRVDPATARAIGSPVHACSPRRPTWSRSRCIHLPAVRHDRRTLDRARQTASSPGSRSHRATSPDRRPATDGETP